MQKDEKSAERKRSAFKIFEANMLFPVIEQNNVSFLNLVVKTVYTGAH